MATKQEARKGIKTQAGQEMANKRFQLDENEADLNNDGRLSEYERQRGEAVQKATDEDGLENGTEFFHGGMPCGVDSGIMADPESGNPVPPGSGPENVRDDIEAMISDGEYVLPADVVKWHGLKHIMAMQDEAKMGLMGMYEMGLIQYVEDESEDDEEPTETPEGNEVEMAEVEVEYEEPEIRETDEYAEADYAKKTSVFGMVNKPKVAFIV